jgi:hypothetical protein
MFIHMVRVSYTVNHWAPKARAVLRNTRFSDSQLEFQSLPEDLRWARPLPEHKPENWDYFYTEGAWCYGLKCKDGTWMLVSADLRPIAPTPHQE